MFISLKGKVVLLCGLLIFSPMHAAAKEAFGRLYQPVPAINGERAQVVYYRTVTAGQEKEPALVYIDREFHTALLPGGYSTFCLSAGLHALGAYLNDAPHYAGKHSEIFQANLKPGKTYYLRVAEDNVPQPVARSVAEPELTGMREQIHMLSRASTTIACQ